MSAADGRAATAGVGAEHDGPPAQLGELATLVEQRVHLLLLAEQDRWAALDPHLGTLIGELDAFIAAGGKRLRPAFCHWGFVAAGGSVGDPAAVDAGAAFELLHAFALMHDDVMDGSTRRRGRAAVHTAAADHHHGQGWNGESRRFGEGVAILLGDLAEVYADRLLLDAPDAARVLWQELKVELNIGQYLDLLGTAAGAVDLQAARRIARYKSGKYTIERPLQFGAALLGRLDELGPALSAYGDPLGEAFQLRDDLLGAFGDAERTGKPVGDDLREGKPTPLLAIARELAGDDDREVLDRIGAVDLDDDEIAAIQHVLRRCGAVEEIEAMISRLRSEALVALDEGPVDGVAEEALVSLAVFVASRPA